MSDPYSGIRVMAIESFDFWSNYPPLPWNTAFSGVNVAHTKVGGGRRGSGAGWWRPGATLVEWSLRTNLNYVGMTPTWITTGFALAVGNGGQQYPAQGLFIGFHMFDTGIGIITGNAGKLEVWDQMNFTAGGRIKLAETAGAVLQGNGAYDYIEFYTEDGTPGTWQLWVNETMVLSGTRDLNVSGGAQIDWGVHGHNTVTLDTDILMDDLYCIGGGSGITRRVLGDTQVRATWPLTPDAVSEADNAWLLGAGADKSSSQYDGAAADNDGDTSYIYSSVYGDRETWKMDLPLINTATPYRDYAAIQVHVALKAQTTIGDTGSVYPIVKRAGLQNTASGRAFPSAACTTNATLTRYDWGNALGQLRYDPAGADGTTLFTDTTFAAARWGVQTSGYPADGETRMSTFVVQVLLPKGFAIITPTGRSYARIVGL